MTPQKKSFPTSFVLLLLVISILGILVGCGGGGGTGPSPIPTPTPTPTQTLVETQDFRSLNGLLGSRGVTPRQDVAGTFALVAEWTPAPPTGEVHLFRVSTQDSVPLLNCFSTNFNCPEILARDIGPAYPRRLEVRAGAGERIFFWAQGMTRNDINGTIKIYFTPS
jgi:hypothetical protein